MKNWNRQVLYQQYVVERQSLRNLALKYGVSHEWIRQALNRFDIPLRQRGVDSFTQVNMTLDKYLARYSGNERPIPRLIRRFIPETLMLCADCGSKKGLHFHHKVYPACNSDDLVILCASCHKLRHSKMNKLRRIQLYNDKINGMSRKELAAKYNISLVQVDRILHLLRYNLKTFPRY
jgi:Mor family transcriptional regulator